MNKRCSDGLMQAFMTKRGHQPISKIVKIYGALRASQKSVGQKGVENKA